MSGITDIISNATAQGPQTPQQYQTWQPTGTQTADTSYQSALGSNMNVASSASPYWQQYLSSLTNNPYNAQAQQMAGQAGQAYGQVGQQSLQNASGVNNAAANMLAAGQQAYQTGMDPQQALYNQTYQQNMDQVNANEAARGITNSGYGADLANQATNNFNIDWQNNQLARQTQGINAMNTANQGGASLYGNAAGLGAGGAGMINQAGQVPLQNYNQSVATLGQGLTGYGSGASAVNQSNMSSIMPYLSLAADQSNQQGQFNQQYLDNMNNYINAQNQQNAATWGSIGNFGSDMGSSQLSSSSPKWLSTLLA